MPNKPNDAILHERYVRRLNALKRYVDPTREIAVNGKVGTASDVVATYQALIDARALLAQKRAEVTAALTAYTKLEPVMQATERALKKWVVEYFGAHSAETHDFGFPPPRVPTIPVEAKELAVARGKATREARHTMGKRQKLKIRGVVPETSEAPAPADGRRGEEDGP